MEIINNYLEQITNIYINNLGILGALIVVIVGSFIPPIPDATFFALTTNSFGYVEGIIISYFGTLIGASLVYYLFRIISNTKYIKNKINNHQKLLIYINKFQHIKLTTLTLMIAIPFLPAFLIHVAAGFVKMSYRKFLMGLIIGKLALVIFWSYIGQSIIDGFSSITSLVTVGIILLIAYVISKLISKRFRLEE